MAEIINNQCFINEELFTCRTCFDPGNPIFSLKDECSDTKTWRDLLKDVAQLETLEEDSLPNTICCKCLNMLIKFYDFIIQIKNVNNKYKELLSIPIESDEQVEETCTAIDASSEGLMDSDNDMPMEEFISEIKVEEEQITSYDVVLNNGKADHDATLVELSCEELNDKNKDQQDSLNLDGNINYISENSSRQLNEKQKSKGLKITKQITELFGERLYHKPTILRRIECKLCKTILSSTKTLRKHLEKHKDINSLQHINLNHPVAQHLFPNNNQLNLIYKAILNDFGKNNYFKYYSVLNEYHYEMSISDTEAEDLEDDIAKRRGKYKCSLCTKEFPFKYQTFLHLKKDHPKADIPFKCIKCKLEFISANLYTQHIKTHCRNEYKVLQCSRCPGTFVWPENLKNHNCDVNNKEASVQLVAQVETYSGNGITTSQQISNNSSLINKSAKPTTNDELSDEKLSNTNEEMSIDVELLLESSFLYYCVMCPKTFFTLEHLNQHLRSHSLTTTEIKAVESIVHSTWWPNGEKLIKCKICEQNFKTMVKLKEHFTSSEKSNTCGDKHSLANYSITNQKGFELHLELDSETEIEDKDTDNDTDNDEQNYTFQTIIYPYSCCMCKKMFKRKYQVAQHQRSMHDYQLLRLRCERCIFRTVSQKILDYHKTTQCFNKEKKYECNQCNFKFMWKENLDKHVVTFHTSNNVDYECTSYSNTNNETEETEEPELPFKCALCKKSFAQLCSLNIHKRLHKSNRIHKCTICQKTFNEIEYLKKHSLSHINDKGYRCNVCNKKFLLESYLEAHRRLVGHKKIYSTTDNIDNTDNTSTENTEEKEYKCNFCIMRFIDYNEFLSHLRIHSLERPFCCTYCEKTFKTKSELTNHKRTHTDQRPFKCNSCGSRFSNSKAFNQHKLLHASGKSYKWPKNKRFS